MKHLYGDEIIVSLGWLPLASLIVFIIAYSSGYANVPFLIMGELFPSKYRSILGSLSSCFNLACTFTIIRSFSVMNKTMGEYGTFWFYMCWCVAGLFFVYFFLPETKGKSFEEIERIFASKKKQQLSAFGTQTTLSTTTTLSELDIQKTNSSSVIFTIEPITSKEKEAAHTNQAYDSDSEFDDDDAEVVATPL